MKPKERLFNALRKRAVDRPPLICPGGMMNPVVEELTQKYRAPWPEAHTDAAKMALLARAIVDEKLFDNYGVPFCMTVEAEAMGATVDLGHGLAEPHVVAYPMATLRDLEQLRPIDWQSGRPKVVLDAIRLLKNPDVPVIGNVPGPVSIATSLIDPTVFYVGLKKQPALCHDLLSFVSEEAGRFARAQVTAGADLITIADPSGTAEILGPTYFETFMIPYLNRMIELIREEAKAVPVILHICGRMQKVFHLLSEIHADVFSFDAMVSLEEAGKHVNVPVMGNISTYAIEHGTPERLRQAARNRKRDGVDIVAPACGLGLASPLENIRGIREGLDDA